MVYTQLQGTIILIIVRPHFIHHLHQHHEYRHQHKHKQIAVNPVRKDELSFHTGIVILPQQKVDTILTLI